MNSSTCWTNWKILCMKVCKMLCESSFVSMYWSWSWFYRNGKTRKEQNHLRRSREKSRFCIGFGYECISPGPIWFCTVCAWAFTRLVSLLLHLVSVSDALHHIYHLFNVLFPFFLCHFCFVGHHLSWIRHQIMQLSFYTKLLLLCLPHFPYGWPLL